MIQAKADGNVPFIGPKSRYSVVGLNPSTLTHKMAGTATINGDKPETGAGAADPTVTAGKALWSALTKGGLFAFDKKAVMVEALLGGTWTIVDAANPATVTRPTPTTFPFRLNPGEWLKAVDAGGGADKAVSCVVRLAAEGIR